MKKADPPNKYLNRFQSQAQQQSSSDRLLWKSQKIMNWKLQRSRYKNSIENGELYDCPNKIHNPHSQSSNYQKINHLFQNTRLIHS